MKRHFSHAIQLVALFLASACLAGTSRPLTVKVLLEEHIHDSAKPSTWKLTSSTGFHVSNPASSISSTSTTKTTLVINQRANRTYVNGVVYTADQLHIVPRDGYAACNDTLFHGNFSLVKDGTKSYLINHVDLEEYVYSVVKTESWPGWPIEVNKAFAISSRSYVVAMIKQGAKSARPYHVKNTNEHQTYRGMHSTNSIRTAINLTKGHVLIYDGHIALTMFDSCCGGVIPAHIEDFDFSKAPYLARTYACTFCKKCKIFAWEKEIHLADISKQIANIIPQPGMVQQITISEKDKAKLVTQARIKKGDTTHTVSGKELYSALPDIKSFCFSVKRKKDKLIFNGKGYGHHIGICQWGAREMVREGWNYKNILSFYYPGTEIKKIC